MRTESFGPGPSLTPGMAAGGSRRPHAPAERPGSGPLVSFARSGLDVPWDTSFGSVLELAEACDVPVRWSCRTGVCHTCETGLLAGSPRYRPEPLEPPADGSLLTCCSQPAGGDLVVDL